MTGVAGYLLGDAAGAVVAVLAASVVVLAWQRLRPGLVQWRPTPPEHLQTSVYADVEDIIDSLDDIARERGWDFPKRLAIARFACENRSTTFEELEHRYERGERPVFDVVEPDDPERQAQTGSR